MVSDKYCSCTGYMSIIFGLFVESFMVSDEYCSCTGYMSIIFGLFVESFMVSDEYCSCTGYMSMVFKTARHFFSNFHYHYLPLCMAVMECWL
jgi:aerobic-type carbon monoxide dehydrogenase small subunit (CoxS/CutS family)